MLCGEDFSMSKNILMMWHEMFVKYSIHVTKNILLKDSSMLTCSHAHVYCLCSHAHKIASLKEIYPCKVWLERGQQCLIEEFLKLSWKMISEGFENCQYKRMWFSHTKNVNSWHMWNKLCNFIHYNVQLVIFVVAYITLKWQFEKTFTTLYCMLQLKNANKIK
jgi:hypothetical protein